MAPPDVLVTADLRDMGLTDAGIRSARRRSEIRQLWRGVDLGGRADRTHVLQRAAAQLSSRAILSGPSAARVHGFDVPAHWPDEITIPSDTSPVRHRRALRVVTRPVDPAHRTVVVAVGTELACTTIARTVADLLCRPGLPDALWVLDQALARRLSTDEVTACLRPRQRGLLTARSLLALGDPLSESPLESRVRRLLAETGVPAATCQYVVRSRAGRFVARVDLAWPDQRLALEADGVGWHSTPEAVLHDRQRQNRLAVEGWALLRCTWSDARDSPADLAATVRSALRTRPSTDPPPSTPRPSTRSSTSRPPSRPRTTSQSVQRGPT